MLDIGFMEIVVIGALALIVVGPKDLPGLLRTVGQFVGKARAMAREFQRTMDDAAREADLGEAVDLVKGKGNSKLPFGDQVVDSIKEFEKTVKTEVSDAARAADGVNAAQATPAGAGASKSAAAADATATPAASAQPAAAETATTPQTVEQPAAKSA